MIVDHRTSSKRPAPTSTQCHARTRSLLLKLNTAWLLLPYVIGGPLYFCPVVSFYLSIFFFFFSSPNLSDHRLDVYHASTHGVALVRIANLECRSEMCCWRLAANTGRKKVAKNRHLGTIAQLRRVISSQVRHLSTIGKKLVKQQYLLYMSPQYGELRPTSV